MKRILFLFLLLSCVSCTQDCLAQIFDVRVVKVLDGDTFVGINRDNLQLKFRISAIDAPEKKQAFGTKSKECLSALIFGKCVAVDVQKQDNYGRYIAFVYTPENKDVSLEMISAGMAWHYSYFDNNQSYAQAQAQAKQQRVGLWADSAPVAPWDFRKKSR